MKDRQDYYRILHVHPDADAAIIKASYRTLMQKLKYHPDLGGSDEDAARINEAYGVLSNPKLRTAYDLKRAALRKQRQRPPRKRPGFKAWPHQSDAPLQTDPNAPPQAKARPKKQRRSAAKEASPKTAPNVSPEATPDASPRNKNASERHSDSYLTPPPNQPSKQTAFNQSKTHSPSTETESTQPYQKAAAHSTEHGLSIANKRYAELEQHTYASINNKLPDTDIRHSTCLFCKETNHFHQHNENQEALICYNCKSPLQFINFNPLWVTQRRSDRLKQKSLIQFTPNSSPGKSYKGLLADLSPTGMRIKCLKHLQMGDILKVESDELSAVASVIRCKKVAGQKYYAAGLKFLALKINMNQGTFLSRKA